MTKLSTKLKPRNLPSKSMTMFSTLSVPNIPQISSLKIARFQKLVSDSESVSSLPLSSYSVFSSFSFAPFWSKICRLLASCNSLPWHLVSMFTKNTMMSSSSVLRTLSLTLLRKTDNWRTWTWILSFPAMEHSTVSVSKRLIVLKQSIDSTIIPLNSLKKMVQLEK